MVEMRDQSKITLDNLDFDEISDLCEALSDTEKQLAEGGYYDTSNLIDQLADALANNNYKRASADAYLAIRSERFLKGISSILIIQHFHLENGP